MESLREQLTKNFEKAGLCAFPELTSADLAEVMEITPSTQPQFGHYQCNSAMRLAKKLRQKPRQIAEQLVGAVGADRWVEKLEVAGPGFINIHLSPVFLADQLLAVLRDPKLGISKPKKKQRIVIDFSSPNIAKEMHVGHLRSTIIGDTLARLFEWLGHDVRRLNHVGDWGTQFGMLITYMKEEGLVDVEAALPELMGWYKAAKKRFDTDSDFMRRSQKEVVALQQGEKESLKLWKRICAISEKAYQEIYDLLGVSLVTRGESFYNNMLGEVAQDLSERNIAVDSDGALCIFIDGFVNREGDPLPFMIRKSDGGFGYATTDMAALKHRVEEEKADRIIVVTDAGQAQHFQMLFKAAEQAGYVDPQKVRLDHVPFGVVLGPDGKKFKTRSGETERLVDLLQTAIDRAKKLLQEKESGLEDQAQALGIGAVKYADLSCNRNGDYTFSYDKMLRFDGNTAAFMMYSYVRVNGIKRKIGADVTRLLEEGASMQLEHSTEIALALHLLRFSEIIELVADELLPNRLCEYLFQLAQLFNGFFRDCRVEGSTHQSSRLLLAEATAKTLRTGFEILGIPVLERM